MNSESYLFNHEGFGEAFIGMSVHASRMTQLERMISEDCVGTGCSVLAPHMNIKQSCNYHLRPEAVQKRIIQAQVECTFAQAVSLCDAWSIIEANAKMVSTFILWIKAKGTEAAVAYFEHLAFELGSAECPEEDCESLDNPENSDPSPSEIAYHPIGCEINTTAVCPECHSISDISDAFILDDQETIFCQDCGVEFTAYKFTPSASWESLQCHSYKRLLQRVRTEQSIDRLKAMGTEIFENNTLNHDKSGVFWYEYGKAKDRIFKTIRANMSVAAKMLMRQIHTKKSKELAAFGCLLYRIQSGQVKIAAPPSEHEWTLIWEAYKLHKG